MQCSNIFFTMRSFKFCGIYSFHSIEFVLEIYEGNLLNCLFAMVDFKPLSHEDFETIIL